MVMRVLWDLVPLAVCGCLVLLAWACGQWRRQGVDLELEEALEQPLAAPVAPLAPVRVQEPTHTIVLKSGSLRRELGRMKFAGRRPVTVRFPPTGGQVGIFHPSHQETDGTWVYRRMGVEQGSERG